MLDRTSSIVSQDIKRIKCYTAGQTDNEETRHTHPNFVLGYKSEDQVAKYM